MFTLMRANLVESPGRMGMATVMSSGLAPLSVTVTGGPAVVVAGMGREEVHEVGLGPDSTERA